MKKNIRPGLTLVELLVVLVILAVMTAIAVESVGGFGDQARYDATQQTLQNVQSAIIGPPNQVGPTGFVADMGRLPVYVTGTASGDPLAELWDPAANSGAVYTASGDPLAPLGITIPSRLSTQTGAATLKTSATANYTAAIPCGWRGPYLKLSLGAITVLDGWGNSFRSIYQAPGLAVYPPATPPTVGLPVNVVCSLGSENAFDVTVPANPYAQDQYVPAQTIVPPTTPLVNYSQQIYGTVTVTVQTLTTISGGSGTTSKALTNPVAGTEVTPMVRVVLFAPVNGVMTSFILDSTAGPTVYNPNTTAATYLPAAPYASTYVPNPTPVDFAIATTTAFYGTFYNVPIGPRAIQAFQYDASPSSMTITKRSPLTYLTVTPNSTLTPTLILQ